MTGLTPSPFPMPRTLPLFLLLLLALLLTGILSLLQGSDLNLAGLLSASPLPALESSLLLQLRLPRLLMALCAGILLSGAGTAIQARFRNPLAEPGLLGVYSGAALAAALALSLGGAMLSVSICAFAGSLLALLLLQLLATRQRDSARLILAGVAISALLGSLLTLLITTLPDGALRSVTFWLMGSFATAEWPQTAVLLLACPLVWFGLFRQWRLLNALQLGDATAYHLGFDVWRGQWKVLALASLGSSLVVSCCGTIGFVGLLAPQLARLLVGSDSRRLLLLSPLLGGWLTISADWPARSLLAPAELPVGVITSLLGAPFFLWLLLSHRDGQHA